MKKNEDTVSTENTGHHTPSSSKANYLLIGSGRVARHLTHYFQLLNIHIKTWDRAQDPLALRQKISESKHILLAISDSALAGFFRQHLAGLDKTVVQFSGAHNFEGMIAAHPLMTFGPELYQLSNYQKIHFTMTDGTLAEAIPDFKNPSSVLSAEQKALYHASCVLGGNFTTLLIAKMIANLKSLNIPESAAQGYLEKVVENTFANPGKALTGPLVRRDVLTVDANLVALNADVIQPNASEIYQSFLKTYWPEYFNSTRT